MELILIMLMIIVVITKAAELLMKQVTLLGVELAVMMVKAHTYLMELMITSIYPAISPSYLVFQLLRLWFGFTKKLMALSVIQEGFLLEEAQAKERLGLLSTKMHRVQLYILKLIWVRRIVLSLLMVLCQPMPGTILLPDGMALGVNYFSMAYLMVQR